MSILSSDSDEASMNSEVEVNLGSECIVCGYSALVENTRIASDDLIHSMRKWSPQLAHLRQDHPENILVLCPNHRREYESEMITVVPNSQAREQMKQHEIRDFEMRQQAVASGLADPGRKLLFPPLDLPSAFEYVPITVPDYLQVYNRADNQIRPLPFRSNELVDIPNRSSNTPIYPLLIAAHQPLHHPARLRSKRIDRARNEVKELVDLYSRRLISPSPNEEAAGDIPKTQATLDQALPYGPNSMVPATPVAHGGTAATEGAMVVEPDQGSSMRMAPIDMTDDQANDERFPQVPGDDSLGYDEDDDDDPVATPNALPIRLHWRS